MCEGEKNAKYADIEWNVISAEWVVPFIMCVHYSCEAMNNSELSK